MIAIAMSIISSWWKLRKGRKRCIRTAKRTGALLLLPLDAMLICRGLLAYSLLSVPVAAPKGPGETMSGNQQLELCPLRRCLFVVG